MHRTCLIAAHVAQLAIHLNRSVNEEGLQLHKQRETTPIIGLDELRCERGRHHRGGCRIGGRGYCRLGPDLLRYPAPAQFGVNGEFLASPRLDNLLSVHASLEAFVRLIADNDALSGEHIPVFVAFDHEEVGSASTTGAAAAR